MYHEMTKHIEVRYYFVHDVTLQGIVDVKKVHKMENLANMLIKDCYFIGHMGSTHME